MSRISGIDNINDPNFLSTLNAEIDNIYKLLNAKISLDKIKAKLIKDVTIKTTGIPILHNLEKSPSVITVILKSSASWWQYRPADKTNIYLQSSIDVVADVVIYV